MGNVESPIYLNVCLWIVGGSWTLSVQCISHLPAPFLFPSLPSVSSTSKQPQYYFYDEGEHTAQDEHDENNMLLPPCHVVSPTDGRPTPGPITNRDRQTVL